MTEGFTPYYFGERTADNIIMRQQGLDYLKGPASDFFGANFSRTYHENLVKANLDRAKVAELDRDNLRLITESSLFDSHLLRKPAMSDSENIDIASTNIFILVENISFLAKRFPPVRSDESERDVSTKLTLHNLRNNSRPT